MLPAQSEADSHFQDTNVSISMSALGENKSQACLLFENSNRLVSLWELMLEYQPEELLKSVRALLNQTRVLFTDEDVSLDYKKAAFKHLLELLRECGVTCKRLQLNVSSKHALHLAEDLETFDKGMMLKEEYADRVANMFSVILEIELSTKLFLQISSDRKEFFDEPRKGWEEVIDRFGDSIIDVEEMRKRFALSRYAGCVFHSVQVIEHGLIDLGK